MAWMWFIVFYIASFLSSFFVQRMIIKIDDNKGIYEPLGYMFFLCFVPVFGLFASLIILFINFLSSRESATFFDKIYGVHRNR